MDEFDKWLSDTGRSHWDERAKRIARCAFIEATRRADRPARIECEKICWDWNTSVMCREAIRATIPDDKP